MERTPNSSRKILNTNIKGEVVRLPSRDGGNSELTSTQDNFFRKSVKSFNTINRNDYGIIKSDLFQLQEMINENSYLIKMYKLTSKSPNFSKRLVDIEENKDIKSIIEKISDESLNIDKTGKLYNCSSTTELIQKLTLDNHFNELLLRKINEYFLILHLKISGDDNLYQETYSKFFTIKLVIEKLIEKYYSINNETNNNNYENNKINISGSKTNGSVEGDIFLKNQIQDETTKLLEIKSINDLLNLSKQINNEGIKNIIKIISEFLDKLFNNYADLLSKFSNNKNSTTQHNFQIENFFTQKLLIEKILVDKEEKIKKNNLEINQYIEINKENASKSEELIKNLENAMKNLEEELTKLKVENLELMSKKLDNLNANNVSQSDANKTLSRIIEESNIALNKMRNQEDATKSRLYEEIKELSTKYEDISNKYVFIQLENIELTKKIDFLSKSVKKDLDFDSYEQLMQEQFDTMKKSFVEKIEQLNEEMNKIKIESRRKVNSIQEDLIQVTHVKDLFLRQITELQKQIEGH